MDTFQCPDGSPCVCSPAQMRAAAPPPPPAAPPPLPVRVTPTPAPFLPGTPIVTIGPVQSTPVPMPQPVSLPAPILQLPGPIYTLAPPAIVYSTKSAVENLATPLDQLGGAGH